MVDGALVLKIRTHSAVCILTGARRPDQITAMLQSLHWLPEKLLLTIVCKCLYGNGPEYQEYQLVLQEPKQTLLSATETRILIVPWTSLAMGYEIRFEKAELIFWINLPSNIYMSNTLE